MSDLSAMSDKELIEILESGFATMKQFDRGDIRELLRRFKEQGEERDAYKSALEYFADKNNWYEEGGFFTMNRPGTGGKSYKTGIMIVSGNLLPWIAARDTLRSFVKEAKP